MKIGLISDTHGLMCPEALPELRPAYHLVHAGDVGSPEVAEALRGIAPLTVIRGNVDRTPEPSDSYGDRPLSSH